MSNGKVYKNLSLGEIPKGMEVDLWIVTGIIWDLGIIWDTRGRIYKMTLLGCMCCVNGAS